jgi:acetyl-CoA acetyltransferase
VSNIARELVFEAGLDPHIPAFSTVLACSTSFVGVIQAAGMVGRGGTHLAMVGGVETMSHVPIALKQPKADAIIAQFPRDPAGAAAALPGRAHRGHSEEFPRLPRRPGPARPAQPPGRHSRAGFRILQ